MNGHRAPLVRAGTWIGIGMGGFVDGILFHQILQFHQMLSTRLPRVTLVNVEVNMFWDGLFHAFTWMATAAGILLLWRATGDRRVPHSSRVLTGAVLLGWGLFNLVEGVIDHQLLGLHHVVESSRRPLFWDLAFLASGVVLIAVGWLLIAKPGLAGMPQARPHAT